MNLTPADAHRFGAIVGARVDHSKRAGESLKTATSVSSIGAKVPSSLTSPQWLPTDQDAISKFPNHTFDVAVSLRRNVRQFLYSANRDSCRGDLDRESGKEESAKA